MSKKIFLLGIMLSSLTLAACAVPKNLKAENGQGMWFPPPPPQDMSWPNGLLPDPRMADMMKQKLDEACLSGIMQTGSTFFQELNRNTIGKMEKLLFIKEKLESLEINASTQSKPQITEQLKIINAMLTEMKARDDEVQKDPNIVCNKTEEIKKMNKNLREKIMWLSGNMRTIREHEQNEWAFQHMKEMIFWEDPKEDFSDNKQDTVKDTERETDKQED